MDQGGGRGGDPRRRRLRPSGYVVIASIIDHEYWIPFGDHPLKLERYRED